MDTTDLDKIEARLNSATPGPWTWRLDRDKKAEALGWRVINSARRPVVTEGWYEGTFDGETFMTCGVQIAEPDADLIAHAPEDLRALVAEVRRLTEERDEARKMLAECYVLSGADADGNTVESGWIHLWSGAVAEVRELRANYDESLAEDKAALAAARVDGARGMRDRCATVAENVEDEADTDGESARALAAHHIAQRISNLTLDPATVVSR